MMYIIVPVLLYSARVRDMLQPFRSPQTFWKFVSIKKWVGKWQGRRRNARHRKAITFHEQKGQRTTQRSNKGRAAFPRVTERINEWSKMKQKKNETALNYGIIIAVTSGEILVNERFLSLLKISWLRKKQLDYKLRDDWVEQSWRDSTVGCWPDKKANQTASQPAIQSPLAPSAHTSVKYCTAVAANF